MSNSLRIRLARRQEKIARILSRNDKITTLNLDYSTEHRTNNLNDLRVVELYLNTKKSKGEWNVGTNFLKISTLTQESMLTKIGKEGRGMISNRNEKNLPNNLKAVDTILKNPD